MTSRTLHLEPQDMTGIYVNRDSLYHLVFTHICIAFSPVSYRWSYCCALNIGLINPQEWQASAWSAYDFSHRERPGRSDETDAIPSYAHRCRTG